MSIDMFKRIMDKAQSETKVRRVQLYMYSDPCLHKDLHLFVQDLTDRGIESWISTMLQVTNCNFEKVIEARPSEFRISFPGWEQMAYFQKGAKPERFSEKILDVCALPRHPETIWTLVWHHYKTNGHEQERAEELARWHNLKFVSLPAIFMPLEKYVDGYYTAQDRDLIDNHLFESPEQAAKNMKRTSTCGLWKQLAIDANGDVYLCQLVYEERFKLVNFLEVPYKSIQRMIKTHDFCGKCLAKGGNQLQSCYSPIATSENPILEANKKRRLR